MMNKAVLCLFLGGSWAGEEGWGGGLWRFVSDGFWILFPPLRTLSLRYMILCLFPGVALSGAEVDRVCIQLPFGFLHKIVHRSHLCLNVIILLVL